MYIAIKYIGKKYTPGEILPDNLPADEVKWLLEAGAIRKAAPAPGRPAAPEETEEEANRRTRSRRMRSTRRRRPPKST